MRKRVGITGQPGFLGTHLANFIGTKPEEFELVGFEDDFFRDSSRLRQFASRCDVIVHLAAMNRGDPEEIYRCNVDLVRELIAALEDEEHKPHVLFSSSTQEERDNPYGRSKKEGRRLFEEWASAKEARFSSLIIPNIFGPFGLPFYNSVVATFCHQLTHGMKPEIKIDAPLGLIYVNDLIEIVYRVILGEIDDDPLRIDPTTSRKVSEILEQLRSFKRVYLEGHVIPELKSDFDVSLFNTFRSYIEYDHYPVPLELHSDPRGHLFEVIKTNTRGQIFYSLTKPGITRGNHYHRRKIERFCVVGGEATIRLRRTGSDRVVEYRVTGDRPSVLDIPIFHTHNITNTGGEDLLTLFWTNEFFDPDAPDTFYEEV